MSPTGDISHLLAWGFRRLGRKEVGGWAHPFLSAVRAVMCVLPHVLMLSDKDAKAFSSAACSRVLKIRNVTCSPCPWASWGLLVCKSKLGSAREEHRPRGSAGTLRVSSVRQPSGWASVTQLEITSVMASLGFSHLGCSLLLLTLYFWKGHATVAKTAWKDANPESWVLSPSVTVIICFWSLVSPSEMRGFDGEVFKFGLTLASLYFWRYLGPG